MTTARIRASRWAAVLVAVVAGAVGLVAASSASAASCPGTCQTLSSSPLVVKVSADSAIQVFFGGDTSGQVYPPTRDHGDSGTYVAAAGQLYGPGSFAETGQTPVSGTGGAADPRTVVTSLALGSTGLQLTETVRLVDGQPFFRIDRRIANPGGAAMPVSVFHYADLYLRGSDRGFGYFDAASGSVGGQTPTADFFQAFTPITPASHHQEGSYSQVFSRLAAVATGGPPLTDLVLPPPDPANVVDNGAALQWDATIPAGASRTFSDFWSFGTTPQVPAVPAGPVVEAVAPTGALPGALLTLTGHGFGAVQGASAVGVRGVSAGIVSWRDDRIEVFVPDLAAGPADVVVRVGGVGSDPAPMAVLTPPPQPPIPNPVLLSAGGPSVTFDATLSVDPDGALRRVHSSHGRLSAARGGGGGLNVLWSFGDGSSSRRPVVTHSYRRPGRYRATLTVTDASGRSSTVGQGVRVASTPGGRRGSRGSVGPPVNIRIPSQVVFDFGSAALRPESQTFLRRVGRLVRQARTPTRIAGYTDSTGPASYNLVLSRERARSVRTFLARRPGVNGRLLRPVGLGESSQLASNATEIGRQRNRRVVVTLRLPTGLARF